MTRIAALLAAALIVLIRCRAETPPPPASPAVSVSRPEIVIDSPRAGVAITENPITVRGTARTFENNVVVRFRDAAGHLMVERHTTATGEMGQHSPYTIDLFVTRDPGARVTIEALGYSAKDGSERSLTSVTAPFAVPLTDVVLYRHDPKRAPQDCTKVVAVHQNVPKSRSAARLAAEVLIAHSADLFPKGAQLRSVNLRDGVLTLDFDESMRNVGGACRAQALRSAIEHTLGALSGVQQVIITSGGSRELALQP